MKENKRDFYKFWLGFIEKTVLVFLVSIFVPMLVGHLEIPASASIVLVLVSFVLLLTNISHFAKLL